MFFLSKKKTPEEVFWNWFKRNEKSLFHFDRNRNAVFAKLRKAIKKVHPILTFEFCAIIEDGKREFVISADGMKEAFPAVESLYNSAPNLSRWKITKFRPRGEPSTLIMDDIQLDPEDIEVSIETDRDKVGLTVFMKGITEQNYELFAGSAFILLDRTLGEYDMETKIGFVDFKEFKEESEYIRHKLSKLASVFDEFIKR